jgi:hypothetical protein
MLKRRLLSVAGVLLMQSIAFGATQAQAAKQPGFYFDYESADGQIHLDCEHTALAPDSGDWTVVCGKGTPLQRNFGVHLVIRKHTRAVEPHMAIEILYFVADRRSPTESRFTSHINWLEFKDESDFSSARLSQSVDNDYAYLNLRIGDLRGLKN